MATTTADRKIVWASRIARVMTLKPLTTSKWPELSGDAISNFSPLMLPLYDTAGEFLDISIPMNTKEDNWVLVTDRRSSPMS
jgi:hypothetical protein